MHTEMQVSHQMLTALHAVVACVQGVATGEVAFTIESPPERGEKVPRSSAIKMTLTLEVIPTPPRYNSNRAVTYSPVIKLSQCCLDKACSAVLACQRKILPPCLVNMSMQCCTGSRCIY